MRTTTISWADRTVNPWTACWKTSAGCAMCYAERLSLRQGWSTKPWTRANIDDNLRHHPERLEELYAKTPARWFVCSMSDFMLPEVPDAWRLEALQAMRHNPQHTYLILTKRPERLGDFSWPDSAWLGVSVENRRELWRVDALRKVKARVRWISFEPLLEGLGALNLTGIHWAVTGGESGPGYRPMDHAWARAIRDECLAQGVAFFFKQSAGPRSETGTALVEEDGTSKEWREYPDLASKARVETSKQLGLF